MKNMVIIIVLALLGAGGTYAYIKWNESQKQNAANTGQTLPTGGSAGDTADGHADVASGAGGNVVLCERHRIPEAADAFCHPELVEKLGFCKGHDVPEAFCTRCSPSLIPAFKAENDWCAEHSVPESQCKICKGDTADVSAQAGGAGVVLCAKHRIPEMADAFCHPELVEKLGLCKEHDVAEAFCTRCSPSLIPAFKVENDWCAEHSLPQSQCKECKGG